MSDRALVRFIDGPMADKSIGFEGVVRIMLRVAFDGKTARCLNNDHAPIEGETTFAYIMDGEAGSGFWDGRDPKTGRRIGGRMGTAAYRLVHPQPPREVLDGTGVWAQWCDANRADLMAKWEASKVK